MIKSFNMFKLKRLMVSLLVVLYIVVSLIHTQHLYDDLLKTPIIAISIGIFIVIIYVFSKRVDFEKLQFNKVSVVAFVLVLFLLINSLFIRNEFLIGAIFNILTGIVIAKNINNFKSKPWLMLVPFYFLTFYILERLYINPNPELVFVNSRNYISFYLIITVLPYYLITLKNKANLLPAIITLVLSFYSLGRSGMVAALLIFIAVVLTKFKKNASFKMVLGLFILLIFMCFSVFHYITFEDLSNIKKFDGINNFVEDSGRSSIISEYLNNMSFVVFLFGMDTEKDLANILSIYGHVHSSLLNFISAVGVASLFFFYFYFLKLKHFLKNNFSIFLLMLSILVRSSTDVGLLFGYFDYVFWMFLFCNVSSAQKVTNYATNPSN